MSYIPFSFTEATTSIFTLANLDQNFDAIDSSLTFVQDSSLTYLNMLTSAAAIKAGLSANGYYKFPGGFIMQWGFVNTTATSYNVVFPIAFPNVCPFAIAIDYAAADTGGIGTNIGIRTPPTTTQVGFSSAARPFYWMALGW